MAAKVAADQEADDLHNRLQKLADEWRKRLSNPVLKNMVESGQMQISPLIKKLLAAFPPASTK